MIEPLPCLRMIGSTCLIASTMPRRFTEMIMSNDSTVIAVIGASPPAI